MRSFAERKVFLPGIVVAAVMAVGDSAFRASDFVDSDFVVMIASFTRALVGAGHIGFDALVRDADGVGTLAYGGAGEGPVETLDIDALAGTDFALNCAMHGGEKFGAQLVQNLVDVNIRQSASPCVSFERYRVEGWEGGRN